MTGAKLKRSGKDWRRTLLDRSFKCVRCVPVFLTCIRLLFGTATNDLTGGVRRGKGAMVISDTLALSSERDRQGGGGAHNCRRAAYAAAPAGATGSDRRPLMQPPAAVPTTP